MKSLSPLMNALATLTGLEARGTDLVDPERQLTEATRELAKQTAIALGQLQERADAIEAAPAIQSDIPTRLGVDLASASDNVLGDEAGQVIADASPSSTGP